MHYSLKNISYTVTSKVFKKTSQFLCNKSSLYCFVKHPTYDIKAHTSKTSPGNVVLCCMKLKQFLCDSTNIGNRYLKENEYALRHCLSPSNIFTCKSVYQSISKLYCPVRGVGFLLTFKFLQRCFFEISS